MLIGININGCMDPYYETEGYSYLTLVNCDGSNKTQLSRVYTWNTFFYNNDQKLLYKKGAGGVGDEIISIDLNTLQLETIFPPGTEEWDIDAFELFPSLNKVIFWAEYDLYSLSIDTGNVENITNTDLIREEKVNLSPSGEYFAYIEREGSYPDTIKWSIKYRNIEGSIDVFVKSQFSTNNNIFAYVDWINDNTIIYANRNIFGEPGIYKIQLDGSGDEYLYEGNSLGFSICDDGSKVVFGDDDEIYLLETTDYSISHLVTGQSPSISPDGNKLVYKNDIHNLVVWDMIEDILTPISEKPELTASAFTSDSQKMVFTEQVQVTYYP